MTSFEPTIQIVSKLQTLADAGIDIHNDEEVLDAIDDAENLATEFFGNHRWIHRVSFTSEHIRILATGDIVEDYESIVDSKFTKNGTMHLILSDGNVVTLRPEIMPEGE